MAYNLESFEVFVVSIPRTRRVAAAIFGLSVVAGLLVTIGAVVADVYTATSAIPVVDVAVPTMVIFIGTFAVAGLVGGEVTHLLVAGYPRNWGYYLAMVCCCLAGLILPVAVLFDSTTTVWFGLGTVGLFSLQALVISEGPQRIPLHAIASAIQPAILFAGLSVALPVSGAWQTHQAAILIIVGIGVALWLVSVFMQWLMSANVTEVGPFEITSHLVQRKELHLGMGEEMDVPVQTLAIESDGRRTQIVAPWIHPGILEGIGGGRLTKRLLAALNPAPATTMVDGGAPAHASQPDDNAATSPNEQPDAGPSGNGAPNHADDRAFFWHVPCTHLSDSPDPRVYEPVLEAVTEPTTDGQASKLISRTYNGTTFHGRRYGTGDRVVYVDSDVYADIEIDIFGDVIDPARTLIVDRHARVEDADRMEVHRESPHSDVLREYLQEFLAELEDQPVDPYRAGDAIDLDVEGISLYALVEAVDGQETVILTADQNEEPEALAAAKAELADQYDEFLLLTTDTHASVYANRFDPQVGPDRIRAVVADAADRLGPAAAGLDAASAPVELLRKDYQRLMFSLNLLARMYIVSLAGLYVLLAVGLFLT